MNIGYSFQNSQLLLSVSDTGTGIEKENLDKLFKEFGKLESNKHLNMNGIGLGLSICKKIAERLDGSISVDPEYLQGARFIVRLKAPIEGCGPTDESHTFVKLDSVNQRLETQVLEEGI